MTAISHRHSRTHDFIRHCIVTAALLCLASPAWAQDAGERKTLRLGEGARPGAARIADVAWLAGEWVGEGLGGTLDESWTAPQGGVMLGMFRLLRDGKPVFYELLTLSEHEGSVVLRLKHFNPDLTGWEEKDKFITFQLVKVTDRAIHFSGLSFLRNDDGSVTAYLALRDKDGVVREETLQYRRKK